MCCFIGWKHILSDPHGRRAKLEAIGFVCTADTGADQYFSPAAFILHGQSHIKVWANYPRDHERRGQVNTIHGQSGLLAIETHNGALASMPVQQVYHLM